MKLFWNSQNDNKSFWGEYHYKNSKKWIFDILSEIKFTEVKGLNEVNYIEPLIIVDSEVQKKGNFYNDFFKKYKNIHLIHLLHFIKHTSIWFRIHISWIITRII